MAGQSRLDAAVCTRPKGVIADAFFQIKFVCNRSSYLLEPPLMICTCRSILVPLNIASPDNLRIAAAVRFHNGSELSDRHRGRIGTNGVNLTHHSGKL